VSWFFSISFIIVSSSPIYSVILLFYLEHVYSRVDFVL
jgi:hypothetical protein